MRINQYGMYSLPMNPNNTPKLAVMEIEDHPEIPFLKVLVGVEIALDEARESLFQKIREEVPEAYADEAREHLTQILDQIDEIGDVGGAQEIKTFVLGLN